MSLPGKPFSKNIKSASECQEICQSNNNCNYFVHDRIKSWCWLKTNVNNQKAQEGSTLGPRYCDRYIEPKDEPIEPDSVYVEPAIIHPRGISKGSDEIHFASGA